MGLIERGQSLKQIMLAAYKSDQRDTNREELARIREAEGSTQVLDMLAGLETDPRKAALIQRCANQVEHGV